METSHFFVADTASVHTDPTNAEMNPQLFKYIPQSGFFFNALRIPCGRSNPDMTKRYRSPSCPSEIWRQTVPQDLVCWLCACSDDEGVEISGATIRAYTCGRPLASH